MGKYLGNTFSLTMLGDVASFSLLRVRKVDPADIPADVVSVIGDFDTAQIVSGILGFEIPANPMTLVLDSNDILYVAQYRGILLPEGATELPEGSTIDFLEVTIRRSGCGNCPAHDCHDCGMMVWTHGG